MTNKEAIRTINEIMHGAFPMAEEDKEQALGLAIKALEFIDENFPKTFIDYLNGEW